MRALVALSKTELRLFFREPLAAFFTLLFPVMLLVLFGAIYGNQPTPELHGVGAVDALVPGYMAMAIAAIGITNLAAAVASYRELGILRRYQLTPIRATSLVLARLSSDVVATVASFSVLLIAATLLYDIHFRGNIAFFFLVAVLGLLSVVSVGFLIASAVNTSRTAAALTQAVFFPMIFLSGAALPRELLPNNLRVVGVCLPLTHVVTLFRGAWSGTPVADMTWSFLYLLAMIPIGFFAASRVFRWKPT